MSGQNTNIFAGRRLWTCEREARDLFEQSPDEVVGVLLQHARIVDEITKQEGEGKEARRRRFKISTEARDRHGDVVRSKGIQLKNFRKNPVVLFAHDARMPPIGKSSKQEKGEGFIEADVDFFDRDTYDFADTIFRIVEVGGMKATSIGFMPIDWARLEDDDDKDGAGGGRGIDFKKIDLLEFSIVPIPANPEAVGRALKDGATMKPYLAWLDDMQDNWDVVKSLLEELDVQEDDLQEVRKAATGNKTTAVVPFSLSPDDQDRLLHGNLNTIRETKEKDIEPITFSKDEHGVISLEEGCEWPKKTKITTELVTNDLFKSQLQLLEEDDQILIHTDEETASYGILDAGEDEFLCELLDVQPKYSVSYNQAHPDGTPAQPMDASWEADSVAKSAEANDMFVMSALHECKPRDDLVEEDFKFLHHTSDDDHPVNFRATVDAIAVLCGAQGGIDLPGGDRRSVYNHLARHIKEDFDVEPPELRWVEIEPLKHYPDFFIFDYEECKLLGWLGETLVDVNWLYPAGGTFDGGADTFNCSEEALEEAKQNGFVVQSVAGKKTKWPSRDAFLKWAKEHRFRTDKVDDTKQFWRLRQEDPDDFKKLRTICINPNDVAASSDNCRVQATGGPMKEKQEATKPEHSDNLAEYGERIAAEELAEEFGKVFGGFVDNVVVDRLVLDSSVFTPKAGYRAMLRFFRLQAIEQGDYGVALWDKAVARITSFEHYFLIDGGLACDVDLKDVEDIEPLEDEDSVTHARVLSDSIADIPDRGRVIKMDSQEKAEEIASHIVKASQEPMQIVYVGRLVGTLDGESVYRDVAAFRWVPKEGEDDNVVRIGLGDELADPVLQIGVLANTLSDNPDLVPETRADELYQYVEQLLAVLDGVADKEDEEVKDFLNTLSTPDEDEQKSKEEDEGEEGKSFDISSVDPDELQSVVTDVVRDTLSGAADKALLESRNKLTGKID